MITTEKDFARYSVLCDCGKEINFASNQSKGNNVAVICECFCIIKATIPTAEAGQRKQLHKTAKLKMAILTSFRDIQRQMTVRQVYYRMVVSGIAEKTEPGYNKVQRQLKLMRQEGILPYSFIADNTRSYIRPKTYHGLEAALEEQMRTFRLSVWRDLPERVEIWLEKDALRNIFTEVTYKYDVPLFVSRGFSSESFIYQSSEEIKRIGKPTTIYFFSDHDPSGIEIANTVKNKMPRFGVDVTFIRVGLTREQVEYYMLPTRKTKRSEKKPYSWFVGDSCELDALHPDTLIKIVQDCISNHISKRELQLIETEESVHKQGLNQILRSFRHA